MPKISDSIIPIDVHISIIRFFNSNRDFLRYIWVLWVLAGKSQQEPLNNRLKELVAAFQLQQNLRRQCLLRDLDLDTCMLSLRSDWQTNLITAIGQPNNGTLLSITTRSHFSITPNNILIPLAQLRSEQEKIENLTGCLLDFSDYGSLKTQLDKLAIIDILDLIAIYCLLVKAEKNPTSEKIKHIALLYQYLHQKMPFEFTLHAIAKLMYLNLFTTHQPYTNKLQLNDNPLLRQIIKQLSNSDTSPEPLLKDKYYIYISELANGHILSDVIYFTNLFKYIIQLYGLEKTIDIGLWVLFFNPQILKLYSCHFERLHAISNNNFFHLTNGLLRETRDDSNLLHIYILINEYLLTLADNIFNLYLMFLSKMSRDFIKFVEIFYGTPNKEDIESLFSKATKNILLKKGSYLDYPIDGKVRARLTSIIKGPLARLGWTLKSFFEFLSYLTVNIVAVVDYLTPEQALAFKKTIYQHCNNKVTAIRDFIKSINKHPYYPEIVRAYPDAAILHKFQSTIAGDKSVFDALRDESLKTILLAQRLNPDALVLELKRIIAAPAQPILALPAPAPSRSSPLTITGYVPIPVIEQNRLTRKQPDEGSTSEEDQTKKQKSEKEQKSKAGYRKS